MLQTDRHVYQVLTKRPARAVRFWKKFRDVFGLATIPAHIWMGTSVENQNVNYRVRHLADLPARIRFLSCEPLLGPIDLDLGAIHWVIAGGESGPERRAMEPTWVEMIRDQCVRARVPFFFKQWGGRTPKAGGRKLGGRVWSQLPDLDAAVA
jgi:protein gp37